jgi:hypothetical protein
MSKALKDAGVLLAIILASALVYWDSLKLRAGTYDPLGSGTMPRIVAGLIIILSLIALAQGFFGSRPPPQPLLFEDEEEFERRPWLAVTIFFYLIGCIVLLALRVPFGISSSLFLFVSCLSIKKFDPKSILPATACSLGVGFGLTYLFGTLFGVDLP